MVHCFTYALHVNLINNWLMKLKCGRIALRCAVVALSGMSRCSCLPRKIAQTGFLRERGTHREKGSGTEINENTV